MRNKLITTIVLTFCLFLGGISFALAQQNPPLTEYKLLEPLPGVTKGNTGKTDANTYLPGLFKLVLALAGVLAVLRIIYGGFIKLSSDAWTQQNEAKKIIWDAFFGLILTLGAWVIVATIFQGSPDGTGTSLKLTIPPIQILKSATSTVGGPQPGEDGTGGIGLSQKDAQTQLERAGVKIVGAILLQGIKQRTINEIITLKTECKGCEVVVTSATGGTHKAGECSHANGWKVDLRITESLTGHIVSNFTKVGRRSDGADLYRSPRGAIYAKESSHWDVAVPCP